jgi:uncharacterized membrane protein
LGLLDVFGKKDVSKELTKKAPFGLKLSFHPLRIAKNRGDSVRLTVKVLNRSSEPLLTSIVVRVPKKLGLDPTCLSDTREIRLGELPPGETRELGIDVFGCTKTDEGSYGVDITAFAHYRNYAYVLNSEKASASLRAV